MTRPTQREFLKLAIPNILTNLTVPLAGLIDMALLGHLEAVTPLAGVALGTLIFDYCYWSLGFLRMSTTALTAHAYGADDLTGSAQVLARSLATALVLGGCLVLLQVPLGWGGFALMQGEAAVEAAGLSYFHARIWSAPATLTGYVLVGWLLGRHQVGAVLLFSSVLYGANIGLDVLFIFGLKWGAFGAGLATMCAEYLAVAVGLLLVWRRLGDHPPFQLGWLRRLEDFRPLMALQGDIFVRSFCLISAFFLFTNLSSSFGQVLLAANTVLFRLLNTAAYFIDGLAYALESLAGKYQGAGDRPAVKRALLSALAWNIGAIVLFIAVLLGAGDWVLAALTHHEAVIETGRRYMPYVIGMLCLSGFAYILDGFFIGLAKGRILRNGMLISLVLGFLPFLPMIVFGRNEEALWWAMSGFMALRALTLAWACRRWWWADEK
ncbi:MATE family efflux transporter [Acanthopleuribacter pedis]|uniref:MATE family efflux transporter n=1 Tax=Acanthopleuribacter pedis TaxID=442870 RepID=A0A8J7Q5P5_9BACT|nr:MATE family efflux transporter [Acanthopleuribacter pedis]MBO1320917.1 MATE family efflux transporter [Acanthopleuribacter pedis]